MFADVSVLPVVGAVFLLAGFVKGVTGMGLPTTSLTLLTIVFGMKDALQLMLIPSMLTNFWQGAIGGYFIETLKRFWLFFIAGIVCIIFATGFLAGGDMTLFTLLLSATLIVYAAYGLMARSPSISPETGRIAAPFVGGITGILTGLTGSTVVPAVPYFQALGMNRDMLIQTMGIWFSISLVSLGTGLQRVGLLDQQMMVLSATGCIPAFGGMMIGQALRKRMSDKVFKQVFFWMLAVMGVYIAWRTIGT
ncbi:MAG: sulfite exporter TauE/SafE family protein [Rhodospirillales bacterium]